MRILIPTLGFGSQGGHRVLSQLATAWLDLGHDCTFLAPDTSSDPYFPTNAKILYCDFFGRIIMSPRKVRGGGLYNVIALYAGLRHIGRDFDIVLANHCLTAWPVALADVGNAKKVYYIQAFEPDYYPALKYPVKHVLSRFSYSLRLSRVMNSETYRERGVNAVGIVPPGIDTAVFKARELSDKCIDFSKKKTIVLGTIGRPEPYKGTDIALAAYRIAKQKNSKLRMRVGFGSVEAAEDIEVVQIRNDVELATFYRSLDILVVACRGQHGAPHYPLIEALASCTPVVHTGYFPGDNENSWVSEGVSEGELAEAISTVVASTTEARYYKLVNGRDFVDKYLSWHAVARTFESLLLTQLKNK